MEQLLDFLNTSYTAYQAVENAKELLQGAGFRELNESDSWNLEEGGKYFIIRGGSALIAFTVNSGNGFKIVASHTDSPALKLKANPVTSLENFSKINAEVYGGAILYSFFDRPLKIAGRVIRESDDALYSEPYVSDYTVVIPSVAVHMQRDVNEKFAPNPQVDLMPLLSLGKTERLFTGSYDLYAVCAEAPFECGVNGELVCSPRVDNLTSVFGSLQALLNAQNTQGVCVAACFDSEEIGSHTLQGAGGDFLKRTLERIADCRDVYGEEYSRALSSSFLISLDNAHSLHPNHPEKCDPTNRAAMGGGIVIKSHAGGAYTTNALSEAVIKKIFEGRDVNYQTFYNRSDMRSGGTLGMISLSQVSILSVDLGIAQLAMHSAVETFAKSDYFELLKGLTAFYESSITVEGNSITVL